MFLCRRRCLCMFALCWCWCRCIITLALLLWPHMYLVFSFNLVPTFFLIWTIYFYSLCFSFYLCCAVISTEPCIITGHLGAVGRDEPAAHQMTRPNVGGHTLMCVPSYTHVYTVTPLIGTNYHRDVHFHHAFQDQGHKHHPKKRIVTQWN